MRNPITWTNEKRMITELIPAKYNPRQATEKECQDLRTSLEKFSLADPIIINRNNTVIGGHFRLRMLQEKGVLEADVRVPDRLLNEKEERELNLRLNKNTGQWDFDALANMDEELLQCVGFTSEEMDAIFELDLTTPEMFDLEKELKKLEIEKIKIQKGDILQLGTHRLICGDSTIPETIEHLMGEEKADMCFTDPPYILAYLEKGKKRAADGTREGFGFKKTRIYLETEEIPDDFTERWMANVAKIAKSDFNIICFENWKNLRTIWAGIEKHWKVKNMIVWHTPNRCQGFSAKYRFFSKHDIAMVGVGGAVELNLEDEEELLQNEYETALYAINGKPQWEGPKKGNKYIPTDFMSYHVADEKSSGQGIIFGTKPLEILIPYLKVLTKRDAIVIEPFGGAGSTLIACEKMKRKCRLIEKVPTYCEVIKRRWENYTGQKAVKLTEAVAVD